ncbi:MAG: dTDP-4-dehydrorhamnose 3,5-epimerase family protein [Lentisphaeria bacterium]|nr:dTDP-4-dehydrorhamnose 3,5-epimerase family protein [Lentisphaeria bacterium]
MSKTKSVSEITGAMLLHNFYAEDLRGGFLKVLQRSRLPEPLQSLDFCEGFISTSRKNVIRGMHFQTPPCDLDKLVTVVTGAVLDVVLDMRKESPTFRKVFSVKLGADEEFRSLFIPKGCAHGFLALEDNSMMLYQTTCEFHPEHDTGIAYDSIGFDWNIRKEDIIISEKDRNLPPWDPEESPFK